MGEQGWAEAARAVVAQCVGRSVTVADIAQLVERDLAKVEVAGSSPVFRSKPYNARMVKLVDTLDLKSSEQ